MTSSTLAIALEVLQPHPRRLSSPRSCQRALRRGPDLKCYGSWTYLSGQGSGDFVKVRHGERSTKRARLAFPESELKNTPEFFGSGRRMCAGHDRIQKSTLSHTHTHTHVFLGGRTVCTCMYIYIHCIALHRTTESTDASQKSCSEFRTTASASSRPS